jgi:hypothetical protein
LTLDQEFLLRPGLWHLYMSNHSAPYKLHVDYFEKTGQMQENLCVLSGTILQEDQTLRVFGNTFGMFVSLSIACDDKFVEHIMGECAICETKQSFERFFGVVADRNGFLGVCKGEYVSPRETLKTL